MPAKQLPDVPAFQGFAKSLIARDFRRLRKHEQKGSFKRLGLLAPSHREGVETGFTFTANGLTVVVWTTFLEEEGRARNSDAGWVLIMEGDKRRYVSRPHHRTKNFLPRLLLNSCIARQRVLNRPLCPSCSAWMGITEGRGLKSRYWKCSQPVHKKPVTLPWDYGLPKDVLESLKKIRGKRVGYTKELKKKGLRRGAAMKKRIGWKMSKPQNAVPRH